MFALLLNLAATVPLYRPVLEIGAIFACICLVLVIYFLPSLIAGYRNHPNTFAIFLLNLLLGWSFFGWVVSLVWASTMINRWR